MRILLSVIIIWMASRTVCAQEKRPFVYDDHGRRDPFWQLVSPTGTVLNYETDFLITDLALEGIMAGTQGENVAIINGRILRIKDAVGQFIVERIYEGSVILKKGKQKFELKLEKGE